MKKLMILAALLAVGVSCTKTYESVESPQNSIGFGTWTNTLTKATVDGTFGVNDVIKVWGFKTVNASNTTVFNGVELTKTDASPETWDYSPKRYWDTNASSYTFFGVAPSADGYTMDAETGLISASPTIEFTGADSDILVADKTVVNKTDGGGNFNSFNKVNLSFNHVAALLDVKVKLSANLAASGAVVQVSSLELQKISTKGTFVVSSAYTTAPAATWTPSTPGAETTAAFDSADGASDVSANLNTNLDASGTLLIQKLIVMPQDFRTSGEYVQALDIDYNITVDGGSPMNFTPDAFALTTFDNTDNTANTGDTNVTGWAPGYHYTYIITIDAHSIEFTASVENWLPATNAYHYLVD